MPGRRGRPRKKPIKVCIVGLCTGIAKSYGLCNRHHLRAWRAGVLPSKKVKRVGCKVKGCNEEFHAKDCCKFHYNKLVSPPKLQRCIVCKEMRKHMGRKLCKNCYYKALRRGKLPPLTTLREVIRPVTQASILRFVDLDRAKDGVSFKDWWEAVGGTMKTANRRWCRLKAFMKECKIPIVERSRFRYGTTMTEDEIRKTVFKRVARAS